MDSKSISDDDLSLCPTRNPFGHVVTIDTHAKILRQLNRCSRRCTDQIPDDRQPLRVRIETRFEIGCLSVQCSSIRLIAMFFQLFVKEK